MILSYVFGIIISYLMGGIPFGYLIAVVKGVDIRSQGSGNIGATNVGRVLGRKYGLIIFVLDVLKGFVIVLFVPVLVSSAITFPPTPDNLLVVICGFCAVLGHAYPVYLKFRGGKAVAASFGIFLWLAPVPVVISFGVWVMSVLVIRYVSLGSMIASLSLAGAVVALDSSPFGGHRHLIMLSAAVSVLIIIRHVSNIQRIISGTEKKVFSKKT